MELRHLRYFCAVASELNLTRAAKKLHIAQPPLTRQIKQLEEELGIALFERHARGLTLTPSGQFFYEHATQMLEKLHSTIVTTRDIASDNQQVFNIGFVRSIFYGELPALVRNLRKQDVKVNLTEMTTVQQAQALKAGRIDIGLGRLLLDDPEIEQQVLNDEPVLAALPRSHLLADTSPTLAELSKVPLIIYPATPRPSYADVVLDMFRRKGLTINIIQEANELLTAIGLVASELGFTIVPEQVKHMQREDIAYVPLAESNITSPILCSMRKEAPSPLLQLVNSTLLDLYQLRSRSTSFF